MIHFFSYISFNFYIKVILHGENEKVWKYYIYGPKEDDEPIIFIPAVSGTGSCFFRQFLSLPAKGHRIISVDAPDYETQLDWIKGLELFLDNINIKSKIHLFGVGLGGYLAQLYASWRPSRVLSLILCNTFADTSYFKDRSPFSFAYHLMPLFMLQRKILTSFPSQKRTREITESVDFMVDQVESQSQTILASKLQLNCAEGILKPQNLMKHFDDNKILILQSIDSSSPKSFLIEMEKFYPNAKLALLKDGGDFPFISSFEEVNLHIEVHLRRIKQSIEEENQNNNSGDNLIEEEERNQKIEFNRIQNQIEEEKVNIEENKIENNIQPQEKQNKNIYDDDEKKDLDD